MGVLIDQRKARGTRPAPSGQAAWRALGWFGGLFVAIGLADSGLHWYPLAFASPEWEFSAVSMSFGALPLLSIGFAALLASLLARGVRWGIITTAAVLIVLALLIGAAYVLFLSDVPLALRAATGPAGLTLKKAIARTSVMGIGFGTAYFVAGVVALRHSLTERG